MIGLSINKQYFSIDGDEDSLFPINTNKRREGGRRREADNSAEFGSSNRAIGMNQIKVFHVFASPTAGTLNMIWCFELCM